MVLVGKQKIINGNTVLVPQYEPSTQEEKEEYEKLRKAKRESQNLHRYKNNKKKAKVILSIALAFAIGITFIWRCSVLYSVQKNLDDAKTQANSLVTENESLKVNLLKNSGIEIVESTAISKLKMAYPEKNHVAKCNFGKDNFSKVTPSKNSSNNDMDIISKIKSMFF